MDGHPRPYPPEPYPGQYVQHGPPHPAQGPPPGPPPEHMIPHDPMGYPPQQHGYPSGSLYPQQLMAINQAGGNRKKSMRASQACDKCRERKSKCDEQRPCTTCKENNYECHYKDTQPAKADKSSGVVTETLDKILSSLESLTNRMGEVEELMKDSRPLAGSLAQSQPSLRVKRDESSVPDSVTVTQHATPDIKYTPNGTINNQQAGLAVANNNQDQGSEEPPQDEPANFSDHTTAAHKLLYLWPSIRPLISNHEPPRDYVMQLEDRGLLRLWGRGEGEEREETMALGAASPAPSDKSEDAPTPPDGTWGNSNPSYSNTSGEARRSVPVSAGGLGMDGRSNLNADVIDRLYRSYNKHIYRLHPFLDYSALDKIIATFIKRYSPDGSAATPSFITNGIGDGTYGRPPKRAKTSQGAITSSSSESSVHTANVKPIERSITSAIVLLVLALGAVCEHIEQLPGPVPDDKSDRPGGSMMPPATMPSMSSHAASPYTTRPSPSSPHSSGVGSTPPGAEGFRHGVRSRRSSFDGYSNQGRPERNVDKIPGLSYYRDAVSILGDFADSNELTSAQARLLAGLYKGQLGRVAESWSWIQQASRTCLYRIKVDGVEEKIQNKKEIPSSKTRLLWVYWTCLQLESDIVAELDYKHSGLSDYEKRLPVPLAMLNDENDLTRFNDSDTVMAFYFAQIFLRKRLNQVHASVYRKHVKNTNYRGLAYALSNHVDIIEGFRGLGSQLIRWSDDEEPAEDILRARLRAKYYGARYVTSRPFLDYALHIMPHIGTDHQEDELERLAKDAHGRTRTSDLPLIKAVHFLRIYSGGDQMIKEQVRECIEAAFRSTTAFDKVPDRLIVTNIMGTAHAQFGNMLVLAATHASSEPWLQALVTRGRFEPILARTIKFLRSLVAISKTAEQDVGVLEHIQQALGFTTTPRDDGYTNDTQMRTSTGGPYGSFTSDY